MGSQRSRKDGAIVRTAMEKRTSSLIGDFYFAEEVDERIAELELMYGKAVLVSANKEDEINALKARVTDLTIESERIAELEAERERLMADAVIQDNRVDKLEAENKRLRGELQRVCDNADDKYHAKPTWVDGIRFASRKEAPAATQGDTND